MKIIHVTTDFAETSGVGTFVRRVNAELIGLGVNSRVVGDMRELEVVKSDPPDGETVFHIHGMWLGLHHAVAKWARKHGVPVIWSTHGMTAPWSMRHKLWKKIPAWWLYQRYDLHMADIVHSTSGNEIFWNARLGLKRQCLVPLGTDLPTVSVGRSHEGTRTTDDRILLFVGRVYPVKALDNVIRAVALLMRSGSWASGAVALKVRIVGPDEAGHMSRLIHICDQLGIAYATPSERRHGSLIEFAGPKFGSDLAAEYDACDGLMLVSHTENFGATVVDAMAYGKPVITSTNTPWKVVRDGGCGWWVKNSPEVLAATFAEFFAKTDEERIEMGRRGRELVEANFTWSAVGKSMLSEYVKLLRGSR